MAVSKYDISKLEQMEAAVIDKNSKGEVDVELNSALLRFYQFNHEFLNMEIVARMLCKALTALPDTDFRVYLHLLSERAQQMEPLSSLIMLAQHLENSRFLHFWPASDAIRDLLMTVPNFFDSIRAYILCIVRLMHSRISKALLSRYLNLSPEAFADLVRIKCSKGEWIEVGSKTGDVISFPDRKEHHDVRLVPVAADFGDIVSLMTK